MSAPGNSVIVSMTTEIEGYSVQGYLGIVTGESSVRVPHSRTRHRFKEAEARVHAAQCQAVENMVQHAVNLGAEAVIGVTVESSSIHHPGRSVVIFSIASGTAVLLEQEAK